MVREIWNDIPGYVGSYQASSLGNIRSLPRKCGGGRRNLVGRILKQCQRKDGYTSVCLYDSGQQKVWKVHQLVMWAFHGFPENGQEILHGPDPTKNNNRLENLRYGSRSTNMVDRQKGSSRFNGVHRDTKIKRWVARAKQDGKTIYIGCFKEEIKAAKAFDAYCRANHLDRCLNFAQLSGPS